MEGLSELLKVVQAVGPGLALGVLGVWAAIRKDAQCTALMERLAAISEKTAVTTEQVSSALAALRDAIRMGTRS